jgi:putative ABC transport system permease protein
MVSFNAAFDNLETFGGGFDVRAASAPGSPVVDMPAAVRADSGLARDVTVVGGQSYVPVKARQTGSAAKLASYPLRGLDDAFLEATTFGLAAVAKGYGSADAVWRAVREKPGLAVVDALVVPRRSNWSFGGGPELRLSGFYLEDETFDPVRVDVRDPETGASTTLTVIGVLKDSAPLSMMGISTSQRTAAGVFGPRAPVSVYYLALRPGADAKAVASRLESRFLTNGVEAQALSEALSDTVGASLTLGRLIEAFMGLGLIVGVAALGVISARAVVERRQQIGVLRAIGFQRGMVRLSFLIESSFIALTAIVVGTVLGLLVARSVIADAQRQPSYDTLQLLVPWGTLAIVFVLVYAVALLASLASARKASRVYPAEALRYE